MSPQGTRPPPTWLPGTWAPAVPLALLCPNLTSAESPPTAGGQRAEWGGGWGGPSRSQRPRTWISGWPRCRCRPQGIARSAHCARAGHYPERGCFTPARAQEPSPSPLMDEEIGTEPSAGVGTPPCPCTSGSTQGAATRSYMLHRHEPTRGAPAPHPFPELLNAMLANIFLKIKLHPFSTFDNPARKSVGSQNTVGGRRESLGQVVHVPLSPPACVPPASSGRGYVTRPGHGTRHLGDADGNFQGLSSSPPPLLLLHSPTSPVTAATWEPHRV